MKTKGREIEELLNTTSAAACDITKPLKNIGDGNMLEGVKNIYNYAHEEHLCEIYSKGCKIGFVQGSIITLGVVTSIRFIPKGVKYIKKKIEDRKSHNQMGEKIYVSLSDELNVVSNK